MIKLSILGNSILSAMINEKRATHYFKGELVNIDVFEYDATERKVKVGELVSTMFSDSGVSPNDKALKNGIREIRECFKNNKTISFIVGGQ